MTTVRGASSPSRDKDRRQGFNEGACRETNGTGFSRLGERIHEPVLGVVGVLGAKRIEDVCAPLLDGFLSALFGHPDERFLDRPTRRFVGAFQEGKNRYRF